ncbi:MFS general substrate transporter [Dissoconium aciculare CBS 342.82]|uniref:MFS general substrate transporter n=1 Tax=Dissoconium aciculare CBS 342.82 TaxID=1314786 RepID=A0A6J3M5Z0_9PEZI|nr:MFS general substrate transporter [Dissoconium aciculare CBS 342.82]KAF1823303.1 MFS general substrate transporter [Dissoconium aciculare CBS 342.82]
MTANAASQNDIQVADSQNLSEKPQLLNPSVTIDSASSDVEDPVAAAQRLRRITRKVDWHVLPWLFALWLLAFIDRSNIGNANISGLATDLKLTGTQYNTALAVFYIPYVLVDIPSNWLLRYVGGGRYIPLIALSWGAVAVGLGGVRDFGTLVVCRMLLGLCEGGMFGGCILYLSSWYPRHGLLMRMGIFYCAAPLSGAFGGLLATGLSQIQTPNYEGWRFIFFVEGGMTILVAAVAFFFLPDEPRTAKFLTTEERESLVSSLGRDLYGSEAVTGGKDEMTKEEHFKWAEVRPALINVNTLLMSLNFFLILIPIYSFSLFLPSIIKGLVSKDTPITTTQLLTVPPNALAFLTVLLVSYLSDRYARRGIFLLIAFTCAGIGYILLLALPPTGGAVGPRYFATFLIAAGAIPCSPLVLAWLSNNLAPATTRATGLGFQVAVGNCGAFVATFAYFMQDAPRFLTGHGICLGAIVLAMIVTAGNMWWIKRENMAREEGRRALPGVVAVVGADADAVEEEKRIRELGHQHPRFRFTM